ncbi:hypothetical protein GKZ68_02690 [Hymenobacter sp. BRD128]|uniref:hypothetical protein n=1 Tax=Hymenobacter sp. BRD128 TaxID=2675878 RepID=UPI0015664538|nr:hypothetical protein [Hymenobacter sp. BRD128]QKG55638.1 hypothetical protein GKZ68_02690 [Hymenobacter sp. BRD128]
MKHVSSSTLLTDRAEPQLLNSGCAGCWAAGYCAACLPLSLQAPAACPLNPCPGAPRPASEVARY